MRGGSGMPPARQSGEATRHQPSEEGQVAIKIASSGQGRAKEAGGKGTCGCDGQDGRPAKCKGGGARCARRRQRASRRTKAAASELHRPPTSMPRMVRWQGWEATSSGCTHLGSTGNLEGCPSSAAAQAARSTTGGERCDEGGVSGDLGSIPKKKAVGNDLYPALVAVRRIHK